MKKNVSSILVLVLVPLLLIVFTGCERLKVSSLKANFHLKKANKYYTDEQYKSATTEYEIALKENPKLDHVYLYLGTSYTQLYKPGKEDNRNKEYGEKSVANLLKAREVEPNNDKVIVALGEIYDKLGNFEEAKKYYMMILEKDKKNPNSYYTLASFLRKNGKNDEAEQMYLQRIALDPTDPSGYKYYVELLQEQRRWADAIAAHKKSLYATLDPTIIKTMDEVDQLTKDSKEIKEITDYMELVRKNTKVDKAEKERLLAESQQKLQGKLSLPNTLKKLDELKITLKDQIAKAEASVPNMSTDIKKKVSECYYWLGNVYWNWSFQTDPNMMSTAERGPIIDEGITCLNKALELDPENSFPYSYIGLLWREKIKINPAKAEEYKKKNEEYNKKFVDMYVKKKKSEDFKKQLEEEGKKQ